MQSTILVLCIVVFIEVKCRSVRIVDSLNIYCNQHRFLTIIVISVVRRL